MDTLPHFRINPYTRIGCGTAHTQEAGNCQPNNSNNVGSSSLGEETEEEKN